MATTIQRKWCMHMVLSQWKIFREKISCITIFKHKKNSLLIPLIFIIAVVTVSRCARTQKHGCHGGLRHSVQRGQCPYSKVSIDFHVHKRRFYTEFIFSYRHSRIRSWNQPVLSNECKCSCLRRRLSYLFSSAQFWMCIFFFPFPLQFIFNLNGLIT